MEDMERAIASFNMALFLPEDPQQTDTVNAMQHQHEPNIEITV